MIHMILFKVSLLGTVSSRVAWLFPKYITNLECNKYIFDYHPQSFNSIYTNWKFFCYKNLNYNNQATLELIVPSSDTLNIIMWIIRSRESFRHSYHKKYPPAKL